MNNDAMCFIRLGNGLCIIKQESDKKANYHNLRSRKSKYNQENARLTFMIACVKLFKPRCNLSQETDNLRTN